MTPYKVYLLEDALKIPFNPDGKILFTSEKMELVHLTLTPGKGMEKHSQPFDVVFFVLEGKGNIEIGSEQVLVKTNTCIHVGKGTLRKWSNTGSSDLKILVIKNRC